MPIHAVLQRKRLFTPNPKRPDPERADHGGRRRGAKPRNSIPSGAEANDSGARRLQGSL